MTKYVLNSGGLRRNPEKAAKFFREIIRGLGSEPRILSCTFADKRERWESNFIAYQDFFRRAVGSGVSPRFEMALPDKFVEQIKNSDAIVMSGGDDYLLLAYLKQYDLPAIWEGKVVATNSASSDALAACFWAGDWRQCFAGLGILPIKFIPHYQSEFGADDPRGPIDWAKAHQELAAFGVPNLPIHALREGEFIVIEK